MKRKFRKLTFSAQRMVVPDVPNCERVRLFDERRKVQLIARYLEHLSLGVGHSARVVSIVMDDASAAAFLFLIPEFFVASGSTYLAQLLLLVNSLQVGRCSLIVT